MADPYQALYRRYRSQRFGEQRGQDHVMRALRTAVQEDRVGHAYLFSGPRGTGKTSTARILAKVLNCEDPVDGEPCCRCENCKAVEDGRIVDWLLELDAASNNGVANIRDLIERIPLGTSGKRKVVILDEVHMLSAGASNALLKSLEEPPAHVVFILATTDPQKVLPTIRSRTQHFEFHLLPADELADHVRHVIADAGLDLGEDAVAHVVRQGGGSARDTLSALDQVAAMGGVSVVAEPVEAIVDALAGHDAGAALVAVAEATAAGRDPRVLGEQVMVRLRNAFLVVMQAPDRHLPTADLERAEALGAALGPAGLTRALEVLGESLVELAKKPDPRIVLEVALVRVCRPEADRTLDAVLERLDRLERGVVTGAHGGAAPGGAPGAASTEPSVPPADPAGTTSDQPSARRGGPADEARAQLAKVRAAAPPPAGPVRAPVKKATASRRPPVAPVPAGPAPDGASPAAPPPEAEPGSGPAAAEPVSGGGAGGLSPSAAVPPLTELAAAWPDVLAGLAKGTRAMYSTGRFLDGDGRTAVLALANEPTRQHCAKRQGEVEAGLQARFGRPVPLRLVIEEEGRSPVADPAAGPDEADPAAGDEEIGDVHELEDAPDAATGVERLTDAFPGAELVEEP